MAQRIIILGAGRFGLHLASRLSEFGCEVILAERNSARVKELAEDGYQVFEMDVEDEDALREVGVTEADAVVVSIGENLQGSVLATLTLKQMHVKRIIARSLDTKHAQVLEKVGADLVVLPSRDVAYRLAERLRDNAGSDRQELSGDYQLARIRLGPPLHGQTISEAALREKYSINVVLLTRPGKDGKEVALEPKPDQTMALHDLMFVSGQREKINRFEHECALPE
jgi:trk system potassium uptake protein